jgi:CBS domain-containing protein
MKTAPSLHAKGPPAGAWLTELPVADVMHHRVVTCLPDTPLRAVARMMANYRIHSVIVHDDHRRDREALWGVVSDRDVVAAVATGEIDGATAGSTAATEAVTITSDESLGRAAQLLGEHEIAHLIVVDRETNRPLGVLSTLDIAAAIGR